MYVKKLDRIALKEKCLTISNLKCRNLTLSTEALFAFLKKCTEGLEMTSIF